MAKPSGGTIPEESPIADANQAWAMLEAMHHANVTRVNREDGKRGWQVTITHAGKRVRVRRREFVDAVIFALRRLRGEPGTTPFKLKLVGGSKGGQSR